MTIEAKKSTMSPEALKGHLRGALAFPITPYKADGTVDLDGVRANARWLPESGVCAIVAPSGTGELFALTPDECADVTRATVEAVGGRTPVIAAVGHGVAIASDLARRAEEAGADGILILPPYYANPDPQGLVEYYRTIAAATSLGVMPYARDAGYFTPTITEALLRVAPNIIAFKDGRGDVRLFRSIREHCIEKLGEDRVVWLAGVGDDLIAPYFASGAVGFTSSLACFWPEVSVELYKVAASGDMDALAKLHTRVVRPFYAMRERGKGFEVTVMKEAMEMLGHPAGPVRPPLGNLTDKDRADLRAIIDSLDIPTAADRMK
jgi:5-dehydro-4-deoxyglucarate dehydratase